MLRAIETALLVFTTISLSGAAFAAPEGRPVSLRAAGQLFGAICQNAYPNLPAAITTAEANGFVLNGSTGLHEHTTLAMSSRINAQLCSAGFVATRGRDSQPGAEFAEWASTMIKPGANPGKPNIRSAPLKGSRWEVLVTRNK